MNKKIIIVNVLDYSGSLMGLGVFLESRSVFRSDAHGIQCAHAAVTIASEIARGMDMETVEISFYAEAGKWNWTDIESNMANRGITAPELCNYTLNHTVVGDTGECYEATLSFMAENLEHAIEQLLDHYRTLNEDVIHVRCINHSEPEEISPLLHAGGNEYTLVPHTEKSCWISAGNASIHVNLTHEGVIVDIYSKEGEMESAITTAAVSFDDCLPHPVIDPASVGA